MTNNYYANNIRVLSGIALLLIALFVSAIALTIWALRADAIRDADNDTGNIAAVLGGQIARSIQSVDLVLSDARDQAKRGSQSGFDFEEHIRSYDYYEFLRASLNRLSQADVVAIIGKDGRIANSTLQWPSTGTDVSDRDYFQHFKNNVTDSIYISNLVRNRISSARTIFFGRRISGPNNEFFGVALIGLRLSYFESIYKTMTSLRDQSFALFHPDGTILIRYPDAVDRSNQKMPAASPWHNLVAAGGGTYRSPGYFDDDARYVSVRPLKDYPLVVGVAFKETAALANWRNRATLIGIGTLFAVVCSAFLLRLLSRQFKRLFASEAALAQRERSLAERTRELEAANFQIDTALNNLPQGVLMFDAEGRLMLFNQRYIDMYGMSPEIVVPGCSLRDLVAHRQSLSVLSGDIDTICRGIITDIAKGETRSRIIELDDGRSIHAVNNPVAGGGWIATHEDITERKMAEVQLAQEADENRRLFETSFDLILVTDRAGNLLRVSPVALTILGYAPDEMVGRNAIDFVYPSDLENTRIEMKLARNGRHTRNFETRYVHKEGRIVILNWSGVWSEPEQKHFFTGRDVTGTKETERKLKHLAHFDQLTGLRNRARLHDDLDLELRPSGLSSEPTAIAIFDLDGFKDINDTLGHSTGDLLLQQVAKRLLEIDDGRRARFYRLGGDEFVLTISGCGDPRVIAQAVDTAVQRLAEKFAINGHQLFIGASAGIAIAPADGADAEELLSNADLALYAAKAAGGNTYRLFVPVLRAKAQARRGLDVELRRACANKEFELFFQPQVSADDGKVVGAEALLRWRHPERGILAPGAFIEALSKNPVVLEIGRWILRTACERAAEWRAAGLPLQRMGVNLFPAQFRAKTLLRDVEEALAHSGLPADALEIEITENIALGEQEETLDALRLLRGKGVKLAFDDFGTGYASLSYLTRYPLTRLKIDQSFIRKIDAKSTSEDTAIVRSIIVMAHNLGLEVIAEGVETVTQAEFLRGEKCDELQGYLYAKPLPDADFADYLRADQARVAELLSVPRSNEKPLGTLRRSRKKH